MAAFNIDQIDMASERITQVGGVLDLLAGLDLFKEVGGAAALSAIWGAQALLEQAGAAVGAIQVQEPAPAAPAAPPKPAAAAAAAAPSKPV